MFKTSCKAVFNLYDLELRLQTKFSLSRLDNISEVGIRGTGVKKLEPGDSRWRSVDCVF